MIWKPLLRRLPFLTTCLLSRLVNRSQETLSLSGSITALTLPPTLPPLAFCAMCQVFYFKQIGMWVIPDNKPTCQDGLLMLQSVLDPKAASEGADAEAGLLSAWMRRGKDKDKGAAPGLQSGVGSNATATNIASRCCLVAPHWTIPLSQR